MNLTSINKPEWFNASRFFLAKMCKREFCIRMANSLCFAHQLDKFYCFNRIFEGLNNTPAWTSAFYNQRFNVLVDVLGTIANQTNVTFPTGAVGASINYTKFNNSAPQECIIFVGENLTLGNCNYDQPVAYPLCDNRPLKQYKV